MTRDVSVPQSLFDEVKAAGFNEQQVVEITATVASYNMVSRFLVALDVGEANNKEPKWAET
jgi:alkylhydroperoxidase family enzyme